MAADWYYQLQGFELGPVPRAEIDRLVQKGRIAPGTLVRRDRGDWTRADLVAELRPDEADAAAARAAHDGPAAPLDPGREPWHLRFLDRFGAWGVALALASRLVPGPTGTTLGLVILTPIALALLRLLLEMARDLRALRR